MKNKNILLINLPLSTKMKGMLKSINSMPPLGLLYIGAYLKQNNIEYDIFDFSVIKIKKEEFVSYLQMNQPQVIGLSTYNETWESQKILSKIIRQTLPDTKIIAGGAFATFCYEDMFNLGIVDYVIRGEGEISFYQLYHSIINNDRNMLQNIQGLVFRNSLNELIINPVKRIKNLDELPYPDRESLDLKQYTIPFTVSTARGCPGRCIFCSSKAFWGKNIYMRSADSIYKEVMDIYNKYHDNIIYFSDDAFTLNKKRAIEFCHKIKKSGINFIFGFESRADVIDENFIQILANAGFKKIQIGLESADNEILKKLKKNVTIEQIENAIQLAFKYKMHISVSYIVGHAFDTEKTIEKTLNFVKHIQSSYNVYTMVSINTPFPGTEQYTYAKKLGIHIHSENWDDYRLYHPIISTQNMSREKLKNIFEISLAISTEGNKKAIY